LIARYHGRREKTKEREITESTKQSRAEREGRGEGRRTDTESGDLVLYEKVDLQKLTNKWDSTKKKLRSCRESRRRQ
jgi:hypothetical protein